jgi:hypothetical protein
VPECADDFVKKMIQKNRLGGGEVGRVVRREELGQPSRRRLTVVRGSFVCTWLTPWAEFPNAWVRKSNHAFLPVNLPDIRVRNVA